MVTIFYRNQVLLTAPPTKADQEFVGLVLKLGFDYRGGKNDG